MGIGRLDTHNRWMVDNTNIYIPSEVHIEHTNVAASGSGRTEDGIMHIDWVRRDVRKVTMTWKALTGNEVKFIRNLMQGKEYTFHYYDAGNEYFFAYTGDNDYSIYAYHPLLYADEGGLYLDFTIDAVEK